MTDNNSSFNITQDYEIIPPKKGKAYPIPKVEWDYLKERIMKIGEIINLYHTAGAILIGFSGSAFITLLTNDYPTNPDGSASTRFIICLSIALCSLAIGLVAFFFGRQQRKVQTVKSDDIIKQMEVIETRFNADGEDSD